MLCRNSGAIHRRGRTLKLLVTPALFESMRIDVAWVASFPTLCIEPTPNQPTQPRALDWVRACDTSQWTIGGRRVSSMQGILLNL